MSKVEGDLVDKVIEENIKELTEALSLGAEGIRKLISERIEFLEKILKEKDFGYPEEKDEIEKSLKEWEELLRKLEK